MVGIEGALRSAVLWKQWIELDKDQVAEVVSLIDGARAGSREHKIVSAMEQRRDELVVERDELLSTLGYHQGAIEKGMGTISNFYEKRKAQDRIVGLNEELGPLNEWLGKGNE